MCAKKGLRERSANESFAVVCLHRLDDFIFDAAYPVFYITIVVFVGTPIESVQVVLAG